MTYSDDLMNDGTVTRTTALTPSGLFLGLGPLAVLGLFFWFASWTGPAEGSAAAEATWVLLHSVGWPLAWVAAAIGFGWPWRIVLAPHAHQGLALQIALGIAAMLWIDSSLGTLGVLQFGGSVGATAVIVIGIALLMLQGVLGFNSMKYIEPPHWLYWASAPAIAVLLLATCSAPGWLWASEFGGYDALEYHLQLPKEWLAIGRIAPLHHNVYSYFPGYVEAAYYHLALLHGNAIKAVYSCQLLHAMMTLLAAGLSGRIAWRCSNSQFAAAIAFVLMLGTPWTVVVGSLGYNEMAAALMLAAGVLVLMEGGDAPFRRSLLIGVIAGTACGAKLTSAGLVAFPLVCLLLAGLPLRQWWKALALVGIAELIVLAPSTLRNWHDCGNPLFPFASSILGKGHWTAEQFAIFQRGHRADGGFADRLVALWNEFVRYGIGSNPHGLNEPWKAQWSMLPWIGILGLAIVCANRVWRSSSVRLGFVLLIQLVFWLAFTHVKSRFLLPAIVPLAVGAAALGSRLSALGQQSRSENRQPVLTKAIAAGVVTAALIAWCTWPVVLFHQERDGSPLASIGMVRMLTGDDLQPSQRREQAAAFPAVLVNYELPPNARVLMLGFATPLYMRDHQRYTYQTTWDRGPLSRLMREHTDDPQAWLNGLREEGYTHLLIDPHMLLRWERSGWNDPLITADRIMNMAQRHSQLVVRFPHSGESMYRIDAGSRP